MRSRWCSIASSVFLAAKLTTDFLRVSRRHYGDASTSPPPSRLPQVSKAVLGDKKALTTRPSAALPPADFAAVKAALQEGTCGQVLGEITDELVVSSLLYPKVCFFGLSLLAMRSSANGWCRRMAGSDWVGAVEFLCHPVSNPTRTRDVVPCSCLLGPLGRASLLSVEVYDLPPPRLTCILASRLLPETSLSSFNLATIFGAHTETHGPPFAPLPEPTRTKKKTKKHTVCPAPKYVTGV